MALVDFMSEPDKAQSCERRKEAVVAKLAGATRTEAALVIADKGYNLRNMLRAAARSHANVDSANTQENLVAGVEARSNLGAGESDLCDRDLAVTRFATRRMENSNPVPGTVAAKRLQRHDNARGASVGAPALCVGSLAAPKTEASSSRSGVRPRSGARPRARSSRPGTPDGPCDTAQLHGMNPPTLPVTGKGSQTGGVLLRRSGTVPPLPWSTFAPPLTSVGPILGEALNGRTTLSPKRWPRRWR